MKKIESGKDLNKFVLPTAETDFVKWENCPLLQELLRTMAKNRA